MRDAFGRLINVGDEVAFMLPRYRNLKLGTVIRITEKRVRVSYDNGGLVREEFLTCGPDVVVRPAQA